MTTLDIQRDVPARSAHHAGARRAREAFRASGGRAHSSEALRWAAEEGVSSVRSGRRLECDRARRRLRRACSSTCGSRRAEFRNAGYGGRGRGCALGNRRRRRSVARLGRSSSASPGFQARPARRPFRTWGRTGRRSPRSSRASASSAATRSPSKSSSSEDCAFGYRDSRFKREPDRFIVCGGPLRPAP